MTTWIPRPKLLYFSSTHLNNEKHDGWYGNDLDTTELADFLPQHDHGDRRLRGGENKADDK